MEVHHRAPGDAIGAGRGALQVGSIEADLLFDDHIALKLVDAVVVADVVASRDLAGGEELGLLEGTGVGVDLTGVGCVVRGQLGGQLGVDHLEDQRTLATEEGVHPLRVGRAGDLDEDLVTALEPDHRLADAELVDPLLQNLDVLSNRRIDFT